MRTVAPRFVGVASSYFMLRNCVILVFFVLIFTDNVTPTTPEFCMTLAYEVGLGIAVLDAAYTRKAK